MKKKSRKRTPQETDKRPKQDQAPVTKEEEVDPFDFGGLPSRNLKKNLGCG